MGDMDSGNSGSIQSSSTGTGDNDQEYESRGAHDSISAFFSPATYPNSSFSAFDSAQSLQFYSLKYGSSSSSPVMFDQHQQVQNTSVFGSLEIGPSNNFIPVNNNSSSSNNNNNSLDMVWPNKFGPIRSQSQEANLHPPPVGGGGGSSNSNNNNNLAAGTEGVQPHQRGPGGGSGQGRNPKKRTRASRRAPTTVMTTDTSNFRQMVQEFTGIPAPPFSGSGFPTRTRLDLFGFGGVGMSAINITRSGSGTGSGSPLRPFPQKIHPNPLPVIPQHPPTSTTLCSSSASTSAPGSSSNMASPNFQNFLTFQSLLQPSSTTMNQLELGHHGTTTKTTTTVTTAAAAATTTNATLGINGGGGLGSRCETATHPPSWAAPLNQGLGLGRQADQTRCSVNDAGGNYTGVINVASSENNGPTLRPEDSLGGTSIQRTLSERRQALGIPL